MGLDGADSVRASPGVRVRKTAKDDPESPDDAPIRRIWT